MRTPRLKFKLNSKLDFEIAWDFYNNPQYAGVDFWGKGALRHHDKLQSIENISRECLETCFRAEDADFRARRESEAEEYPRYFEAETKCRSRKSASAEPEWGFQTCSKKKIFLSDYIESFYKQHNNKFEQRKKEVEVLYKKGEQTFFDEVEKIFKDHPWPKGTYIAYLSLFDFCPRFLDDKTFSVFLYDNDENTLFTIFHEMLHFIFYDYCLKRHPKIFKKLDTERGPFWEIAEMFNAVVQQTPVFSKLHGPTGNIGYPGLKLGFEEAKKAWNGNIDDWITTFGMSYIEKS